MAKKNPIIAKARKEGYNAGFMIGLEHGKNAACEFFAQRFEGLNQKRGIGPKTMKTIVEHFGEKYFEVQK